jgi:uncharacterized protein YegJ (DUF2314 family)
LLNIDMKLCISVCSALLLIACGACSKTPDTLVQGGYDEQEMQAEIARARSEVDTFLVELSKANGTDFSVKAPIEDKGKTEHFWLTDIVYQDDEFEGLIGNDPGVVGNVKFGQKWKIKKAEISDWMFMRDGKMHGNYTMRPLLKTMPKEQADEFRALFAKP